MKTIILALLLLFITNNQIAQSSMPSGVDWHQGTIKSAFTLARKTGKPLFLYWGAVWCPPCNQMKKTVFSKKVFRNITKKFVAVYLDGDEERAQIWSDKLKAFGYPTMMIFDPQGNELMRLPTGVSAKKYVDLMQITLKKMIPINTVLKNALEKEISQEEWQLLSGYSWPQNRELKFDRVATFEKLFNKIKPSLAIERSRLFMLFLTEKAKSKKPLTKQKRVEYKKEIEKILSSEKLVKANLETLTWSSGDIFSSIYQDQKELKLITKKLIKSMRIVENDSSLSLDERVSSLHPLIVFNNQALQNKEQKTFPPKVISSVLEKINWANQEAKDPYARQSVMSTAIYLLKLMKQYDQAEKMALAELKKSKSPFYFMSYLASLSKEKGDIDKSIEWRKKAWEISTGKATRFQWGVSYLISIIELKSENLSLIENVSLKLFMEAIPTQGAFSGRNFFRVKRLSNKFQKWAKQKDRKKLISKINGKIKKECPKSPNNKKCVSLFEKFGEKEFKEI